VSQKADREIVVDSYLLIHAVRVYSASPLVISISLAPLRAEPAELHLDDELLSSTQPYVPAFLVLRANKMHTFEDWRPTEFLVRERARNSRFHFFKGRWHDRIAERLAWRYGLSHQLWTEEAFNVLDERGRRVKKCRPSLLDELASD
jgi:hypothetical protein